MMKKRAIKYEGKDCKKNNLIQKGITTERMGKKRSKWQKQVKRIRRGKKKNKEKRRYLDKTIQDKLIKAAVMYNNKKQKI